MIRTPWYAVLLAALAGVLAIAAACGDDDDDGGTAATPDPAAAAEVEDLIEQLLATDPTSAEEVDFLLSHMTADAINYFGYETADDCRANVDDCIGEPAVATGFADTRVSADAASTIASTESGDVIYVALVREDDFWKLNGFAFTAAIPAGTKTIEVRATDYGYDWDPVGIEGGNFALVVSNGGAELHEAAVVKIADDYDVEEVIAYARSGQDDEDSLAPGVEEIVAWAFATPGTVSNVVFEEPLAAGNYALVCFIPNSDGEPHIALGMHSEFSVPQNAGG